MRKLIVLFIALLFSAGLSAQLSREPVLSAETNSFKVEPSESISEITANIIENELCVYSFILKPDESDSPLVIKWSFRTDDMQFVWTPEFQGSLKPDWHSQKLTSRATTQAPVLCITNGCNKNKYTLAVSDALNTIDIKAGVVEETSEIEVVLTIYQEAIRNKSSYAFDLRIDKRPVPYWQVINDVSSWWASLENYKPLNVPDVAKKPMYSSWYTFHQNIEVNEVIDECLIAKSVGCHAVIIDDGWQTMDNSRGYAFTGDWKPERIPDMKAFADSIHLLGMKFILWYSVPFVGILSEAKKQFEGKFLNNDSGLKAFVLDPRYPEVRDYLIGTYKKAVVDWNIDGFKLDFVDKFKESSNTPPFSRGMDFGSVNSATDRLLTDVMKELKALNPDILIEFRQNYIGPLMRKYGNMFRATDAPYGLLDNRTRIVNLRLLSGRTAVHSDMLMWNHDETKEVAALQLLNVIFSVPQISVRLENYPNEHLEMLSFWLKFWNDQRETLLNGSFEPYYPNLNYPLIWGKSENTMIAGIYSPNMAISVDTNKKTEKIYLINASESNELIIDFLEKIEKWNMKIYDCSGKIVEQKTINGENIQRIKAPLAGLVEIFR